MFSKKPITICLFILILSGFLRADDDAELKDQKRQVYMLKGQLYEQQNKARLAKIAEEKNGLFVGGVLGTMTISGTDYEDIHPIVFGAKVGYQKYLNNYIAGLRFYGEYLGSSDFEGEFYQLGSVNLDLIADIPLDSDNRYSIGVFAGIGMGWTSFSEDKSVHLLNNDLLNNDGTSSKSSLQRFGPVVNLGIAITLDLKNRIELEMKIPPIKLDDSQKFKFSSTNLYFVSYNFLF